jgi:uncharacterized protein
MRIPFARLALTAMALWMAALLVIGAPVAATQQDETAQVERVVIDLIRAEANGDYSLLYDYMAPESRDMLPRQAFISWYLEEAPPVPAGPPEIASISFADGEYEATGTNYENLAYVELFVPLENGDTDAREMLLSSDGITWRWFLTLPEDDIDGIAETYGPFTVEYETLYRSEMYQQLDLFWAQVFADYGAPYRSPIDMVAVNVYPTRTACGEMEKEEMQGSGAIYCGLDETIYFDMDFRDWFIAEFGEYGWDQVIAHEWGHHIQKVLGLFTSMDPELYGGAYTIEHELQADCLAAMFTQDLRARGLIRNRDVRIAESITEWVGDMEGTPWDEDSAHGTPEQRVQSFWLGYDDGLRGCYVNIASLAD